LVNITTEAMLSSSRNSTRAMRREAEILRSVVCLMVCFFIKSWS
jgi:hypothetical protein